ncbi:MAG: hypothetical protein SH868_00155 [Bythopirellula sp.]|nr:hypothetical protein [Bythopirellula sp.]
MTDYIAAAIIGSVSTFFGYWQDAPLWLVIPAVSVCCLAILVIANLLRTENVLGITGYALALALLVIIGLMFYIVFYPEKVPIVTQVSSAVGTMSEVIHSPTTKLILKIAAIMAVASVCIYISARQYVAPEVLEAKTLLANRMNELIREGEDLMRSWRSKAITTHEANHRYETWNLKFETILNAHPGQLVLRYYDNSEVHAGECPSVS